MDIERENPGRHHQGLGRAELSRPGQRNHEMNLIDTWDTLTSPHEVSRHRKVAKELSSLWTRHKASSPNSGEPTWRWSRPGVVAGRQQDRSAGCRAGRRGRKIENITGIAAEDVIPISARPGPTLRQFWKPSFANSAADRRPGWPVASPGLRLTFTIHI